MNLERVGYAYQKDMRALQNGIKSSEEQMQDYPLKTSI